MGEKKMTEKKKRGERREKEGEKNQTHFDLCPQNSMLGS